MKPHQRKGQIAAAEHIVKLVEQCGLGHAEIKYYTVEADGEEYPMVKILSEFGPSAGAESSRELQTWLGHLDTVALSAEQKGQDAMVIESRGGKTIAKGRGTVDMWGGNVAKLRALQLLHTQGQCRYAIQTLLPAREEAGSEVLWQAIQDGFVETAKIGATTEITTYDDGKTNPVYRARTGRIGLQIRFKGKSHHAGKLNRQRELMQGVAHRHYGVAINALLAEEDDVYFSLDNQHPDDSKLILPQTSFAIPGTVTGLSDGLNPPPRIFQHFNFLFSDPNLAPDRVKSEFKTYLVDSLGLDPNDFELTLEPRGEDTRIPFTEPYLTPHDHPLVETAEGVAQEIDDNEDKSVAADGVAEDGMIAATGTLMVGKSPRGRDAHRGLEEVEVESIDETARWLAGVANPDHDIH